MLKLRGADILPNEWSRFTTLLTLVVLALAGCAMGGKSGAPQVPSGFFPTNSPATNRSAVPITSGEPSPHSVATGDGVCSPADVDMTLVSDRTQYRTREPVSFTVTVTNARDSPCNLPAGNCLPQIQVANSTGGVVWDRAATVVVCTFGAPIELAPGTTTVQTVVWDGTLCAGRTPESCTGRPVDAGTYQAIAEWNGSSGTTTFIVAG
jgi:hypothetical protein